MVYHSYQLDTTFFALADPTRREILARLTLGERTISELAKRFDMSLPGVSKHIRVLQNAGLATIKREGRVRRARLNPDPMRVALEWMEHYRRFWESELEQLATYLERSPQEQTWPPKPPEQRQSRNSKSTARSARRKSASSTRGRNRKN
ncbi:MAG: metalloregulator ArsR/SmtB family transcription factor [Gemmatimonadota bacterium]|nr:metalloregulator ArsR/SmtB family transcription factor [Gemmatimonadota bacterium]